MYLKTIGKLPVKSWIYNKNHLTIYLLDDFCFYLLKYCHKNIIIPIIEAVINVNLLINISILFLYTFSPLKAVAKLSCFGD